MSNPKKAARIAVKSCVEVAETIDHAADGSEQQDVWAAQFIVRLNGQRRRDKSYSKMLHGMSTAACRRLQTNL